MDPNMLPQGQVNLTSDYVWNEGFKNERSKRYYLKQPRRWSFGDDWSGARLSQNKVLTSWHGESADWHGEGSSYHGGGSSLIDGLGSQTSEVDRRNSKNCFTALYRWYKGLTLLQKIILWGVIVAVIIIIALIIYISIPKKNDDETTLTSKEDWLPVWPAENEEYPDHCVTPEDFIYVIIHCHGLAKKPYLKSRINTVLHAIMTENTWKSIDDGMFSNLPKLQSFDLSSNGISDVSSSAFKGLGDLMDLNISRNEIAVLNKDTFKTLSQLEKIRLSHNNIRELHKKTFNGLSKLREIWLDHNLITDVSPALFQNLIDLTYIHLEHNKITEIHSGTFIGVNNSGGHIILSDNKITNIENGAFALSEPLHKLDLLNNPLTCDSLAEIPKNVQNLMIPTVESCDRSLPGSPEIDHCQDNPCPTDTQCENTKGNFICQTIEPQQTRYTRKKSPITAWLIIIFGIGLLIIIGGFRYLAATRSKKNGGRKDPKKIWWNGKKEDFFPAKTAAEKITKIKRSRNKRNKSGSSILAST